MSDLELNLGISGFAFVGQLEKHWEKASEWTTLERDRGNFQETIRRKVANLVME